MAVEILRRRFTVDEYHRMGEMGILREEDRVELIDGEIVQMTPIGSRHAACVNRLNRLLVAPAGERAIVAVQNPIAVPPDSEPQPDLALLRPRSDFYARAHPEPSDVWLVIEVADVSAAFDRAVKIPLYARAAIPEVWLVDLAGECVEVYRGPTERTYAHLERRLRGQRLAGEALPDLALSVDEVLGTP
ncbi:MAG TPA: Uma2 family endonuclease [Methylomirabilota bacterium]|jgi:Uma2 family endonuclease|nr:Uma2 family endonuclease [Methylomirabilota bacterium]HEV8676059.1 Uma2 family endonuclease [Methylomirabilota bacterium]